MAVTLVLPGNGSESAWRTPVFGWSAIKVDKGTANHPKMAPLYRGGRCGNINPPLQKEEVFVLAPGESKKLYEWTGFPQLPEPGTYGVVFFYADEPNLKWRGIPLGQHNPEGMKRV